MIDWSLLVLDEEDILVDAGLVHGSYVISWSVARGSGVKKS